MLERAIILKDCMDKDGEFCHYLISGENRSWSMSCECREEYGYYYCLKDDHGANCRINEKEYGVEFSKLFKNCPLKRIK